MNVSGLLLAAGAGVRLGRAKADVTIDGVRLLDRTIEVLRSAGCTQVVAVLRDARQLAGVTTVLNPDPDRGQGSSLRLGLSRCTGDIAVIMLVDTPGIGAAAVRAVVAGVEAGSPAAIAEFAGHRAPPVAFVRALWADVAELAVGDEGARAFLRAHPDQVTGIACCGDPSDIDTPEDLARWGG